MMLNIASRQEIIQGIIQFEAVEQSCRSYPELCFSKLFSDYLRETGERVATPPAPFLLRINTSDIEADAYK